MVSPKINACALAATLPDAKLIFLNGVGHMPHHAAPEVVAAAIDQLSSITRTKRPIHSARVHDQIAVPIQPLIARLALADRSAEAGRVENRTPPVGGDPGATEAARRHSKHATARN